MGSDDCHRCERPVLKNGRVGASYNIGNREESRVKYAFFLSPAEAVFLEFINVQHRRNEPCTSWSCAHEMVEAKP